MKYRTSQMAWMAFSYKGSQKHPVQTVFQKMKFQHVYCCDRCALSLDLGNAVY